MNIQRACLPALLVASLLALKPIAAADEPRATAEQNIAAGSSIRLHLESGDYTIQATDSDKVVVTYHTRSDEQLKLVHVE